MSELFLKYGCPVTLPIAATILIYPWVSEENQQKVLTVGVASSIALLSKIFFDESIFSFNNKIEQPGDKGFVLHDYKEPWGPGFIN